jgi:hypothetical protein
MVKASRHWPVLEQFMWFKHGRNKFGINLRTSSQPMYPFLKCNDEDAILRVVCPDKAFTRWKNKKKY